MKRNSPAFLLSLLLTSAAHANCAAETYSLSGIVSSSEDSAPVEGTKVAVTYDQPGQGPPELPKSASAVLTAAAQTDHNGRYQIDFVFQPYSVGRVGTDECKVKLMSVTVSVSSAGFELLLQEQRLSGVVTTANYSLKRTAASRHGVN